MRRGGTGATLAISRDGGATFDAPARIDDAAPDARVRDATLAPYGRACYAAWIEDGPDGSSRVRGRAVEVIANGE